MIEIGDTDRYDKRDNHVRRRYFADHSHDEMVGYHSEHQINSKYERKIRQVPTQQHFQPQHSVDHPGYPSYYTNYQYASQHPDLIKHFDSNQNDQLPCTNKSYICGALSLV